MTRKDDKTIESTFALLDVKGGRDTVKAMVDGGACVPVTIEGVLQGVWGGDDGVSREFEVRVTKVTARGRVQGFIACKDAKIGTKVITDGGFTCLPENAVRTIRGDKDGEFIACKNHGRHYLSGQHKEVIVRGDPPTCNDVYVGLYKAN